MRVNLETVTANGDSGLVKFQFTCQNPDGLHVAMRTTKGYGPGTTPPHSALCDAGKWGPIDGKHTVRLTPAATNPALAFYKGQKIRVEVIVYDNSFNKVFSWELIVDANNTETEVLHLDIRITDQATESLITIGSVDTVDATHMTGTTVSMLGLTLTATKKGAGRLTITGAGEPRHYTIDNIYNGGLFSHESVYAPEWIVGTTGIYGEADTGF